jgi:hypothetical protein
VFGQPLLQSFVDTRQTPLKIMGAIGTFHLRGDQLPFLMQQTYQEPTAKKARQVRDQSGLDHCLRLFRTLLCTFRPRLPIDDRNQLRTGTPSLPNHQPEKNRNSQGSSG